MNTDISIRPSYLGSLPDQGFAEQIGFVRPPRISMLNDRFNPLDENGAAVLQPSLQLQVIMLWENDTRIYYPAGEYEPDSATPPSCYSNDKVRPSDGAMQPQHETCAGCPRSVRDIPSFNGKTTVSACKERYKLACLVAGAKGKVFLLDVGPASRRAYANYRNFLKQHHALPNQVITRLDYADKAFGFSFGAWIDERTADMVKRIAETDEPAMVVDAFDKPRQTALPRPEPKPQPLPEPPPPPPIAAFDDSPASMPQGVRETMIEPPKRGRGRPPKEAPTKDMFETGPAPASFAEQPTPQPSAPAPKPSNGSGFGMEAAKAPPEDLQAALNRAFMK